LVAEYGDEVLALPRKSGFNWVIYVVPIFALAIAATLLAVGARRWRRAQVATDPQDAAASTADVPSPADATDLDTDMNRYDL
ncbi:MAG: cytochrome c-type biogenesis protein CcmH, partial [Thermoleophilaceae bacterium]|nr:cytochrome c-type biogenesis protein CcmH [Thermoleophilaceae bacterium]